MPDEYGETPSGEWFTQLKETDMTTISTQMIDDDGAIFTLTAPLGKPGEHMNEIRELMAGLAKEGLRPVKPRNMKSTLDQVNDLAAKLTTPHPLHWSSDSRMLANAAAEIKEKTGWELSEAMMHVGMSVEEWPRTASLLIKRCIELRREQEVLEQEANGAGDPQVPFCRGCGKRRVVEAGTLCSSCEKSVKGAAEKAKKKNGERMAKAKPDENGDKVVIAPVSLFRAAVVDGSIHAGRANQEIDAKIEEYSVEDQHDLPDEAWEALLRELPTWETQKDYLVARDAVTDFALKYEDNGAALKASNRLIKEHQEEHGDSLTVKDWEAILKLLKAELPKVKTT